jgi:Type II CAAX prenyl endopeptidase Rce1-like
VGHLQFAPELTVTKIERPQARASEAELSLRDGSGPWADLGLTLPVFLAYHLGVVFLPVRNAADVVTRQLTLLAENNLLAYAGLTLGIGALFVGVLMLLGRGHTLSWGRFALVALEGVVYAVAMRLAAHYVIGALRLSRAPLGEGGFTSLVMSLGAGFYEEIAFRVLLFGLGLRVLLLVVAAATPFKQLLVKVGWALFAAAAFSAWHYVGDLGDVFDLRSFVFRWVCGVVFTLIYAFRGFAPAVWTHTLYDAWVLVL